VVQIRDTAGASIISLERLRSGHMHEAVKKATRKLEEINPPIDYRRYGRILIVEQHPGPVWAEQYDTQRQLPRDFASSMVLK
jgi:hypothetical protein